MSISPVVLVVLDGWGIAPDRPGNAIAAANTPNMDHYLASYPNTQLRCSGKDVGLPDGQMGNSEVGHLNIGAGFVVYQSITRIDRSIQDRSFMANDAFHQAINHAHQNDGRVHLIGLIGRGGVHAHHRHWRALLELCRAEGTSDVVCHAITDGRDTEPTSGTEFMRALLADMDELGVGRIGTISGRYYTMDRDKRWERTARAWDAIVHGNAPAAPEAIGALEASYTAGVTDEFVEPVLIGERDSRIRDGDAVIFVNFRADRMRQIVSAFALDDFNSFERGARPSNICITTMTEYEPDFPVQVAFPPEDVVNPVARVISDAGLRQFHTAETEKYAHVTYFINGGREAPFPGEDRKMIPSPKVATYDLQPEMSAIEVTDAAVEAIESGDYSFIVINYANGDMVGHTGVFEAAVKAIETVDSCLGRIVDVTMSQGGAVIATADHGNADEMLIPGTEDVWTAHTMNLVPLVIISPEDSPARSVDMVDEGRLADIAPTVLKLLKIEAPREMTGIPLYQ